MEKERKTGYFAKLKRRKHIKLNQSEPSAAKQNQAQQNHSKSLRASALAGHKKQFPAEREKSSASMTTCAEDKKTCLQEKHGITEDNHDKKDGVKKEKRGPPGTVEYTVVPQDTLNSIALKFNIMPNKLVQLNRLFSHSVVPGQTLFVPDMGQSEDLSSKPTPSIPFSHDQSDKLSKDTNSTQKNKEPIQRVQSSASEDEEPPVVKFLKMSCRYFTDGMGVVGGVLIVTPNNIMFDPHKSDPLVIENGCEEYGLICPMEEVVSIALYNDISHMKLKDALPSPGEWEDLPSERDLNPFSRFEALGHDKRPIVLDAIEAVITDSAESETAEKTPSDEGFTELELPSVGTTDESQGDTEVLEELGPPKIDSSDQSPVEACSSAPSETQMQQEELVEKEASTRSCIPAHADCLKQKTGHELQNGSETSEMAITAVTTVESKDLNLAETEKLERDQKYSAGASEKRSHPDSDKDAANGLKATVNGPDSREPSIKRTSHENLQKRNSEMEMQSWLLEHMQLPIENMLLSKEEKSKNPPMFLCFRVGKPMRKSFALGQTSSPAHHYRVQGHHPEYWFAVPQERVDNLYAFFVHWSPDVYGKDAREQGFIVVEKDELDMIDNFFSSPTPKSWEIITVNEARRRQSVGSFDDDELLYLLPTLTDNSLLLEDIHIHKLTNYLPARIQGYPWRLAYSTAVHGTSLKTLYRNLTDLDSPVLLVIKDMHNQVFGAFSSHPFRVSEHCYGTGETFLYSFCPDIRVYIQISHFKTLTSAYIHNPMVCIAASRATCRVPLSFQVFRWSGENSYFVKGSTDSLQIGGGKGHFGLWLDADLHHGSSRPCSTFRNQPLSAQQDFDIQDLEIWTFL